MPSRIADYFVVCGLDPDQDFPGPEAWDNEGGNASVRLKSAMLDRVPAGDHKDAEFPQNLDMFCFSSGLRVSSETPAEKLTKFSFVLTEVSGTQLFCSCLTFHERQQILAGESEEEAKGSLVYVPKCICLVSHWPFFQQFGAFTEYVYMVYKNSLKSGCNLPLERLLANFMFETPFPPRGRITVKVNLEEAGSSTRFNNCLFQRPAPNKLPLRDFSFIHLFRLLSVENIVLVFSCILNERRVLFVSNRVEDLCIAAESFKSLLFPMIWRHIYVPVLPEPLLERVCAPFPYIMGVTENCMPDEKLLDGVIQVDLHKNKISQYRGGEEINHLTDKLQGRLLKGLKKVVGDPAEPLGPGTIDENTFRNKCERDVEHVFLKFFVKLFRTYKRYVEAPSEEVVEKFNKEGFLENHPDKCDWLREVMETQMFQCFVDERYEYSTKTDNLEVLFFDEWIDKVEGKQTAFLSDTSQDHRPDKVEVAMKPNTEGIENEKRYSYITFPKLDPNLMLPVRKPKKLVTEAEEKEDKNTDRRIDMSKMAMKFFKEKRLYSQHFHSLSLHSRKQNSFFNSLVRYLKAAQAHEERFAKAQLELYRSTLGRFKFYPTATTIDDVWAALQKHVRGNSEREIVAVRDTGNLCCQDLYTTAFQVENSIDLLLVEAEQLEKKTGRGKNRLEKAKASASSTKSAYKKLRKNLLIESPNQLLTQNQLTKVVSVQCAMEDAALGKVEAATDFRTVLAAYESRMPVIVNTIRSDNIKRIEQFKSSMTTYLRIKRKALESSLETLTLMEQKVEAIDTKRDMELFTQGTTDFWHVGGGQKEEAGKRDNHHMTVDVDEKTPTSSVSANTGNALTETKQKGMHDQTGNVLVVPPDLPIDESSGMDESVNGQLSSPPPQLLTPNPSTDAPPLPSRGSEPPSPRGDSSPRPPPKKAPPTRPTVDSKRPAPPPRLPSEAKATPPPSSGGGPPPLPSPQQIDSPVPPVPPKKRAPNLPPGRQHRSQSSNATVSSVSGAGPPLPPKVHSRAGSRVSHANSEDSQPRISGHRPRRTGGAPFPPIDALARPFREEDKYMSPSKPSSPTRRSATAVNLKHYMRSTTTGRTLPASPMGYQSEHGSVKQALGLVPQSARRRAHSAATGSSSRTGVITATKEMNNLGELSYTLDMWGGDGFEKALARATETKSSVKKFTTMLEEWSAIVSQVGRKYEAAWKSTPAKVAQETSMMRVWDALRNISKRKMDEYIVDCGKKSGIGFAAKLSGLAQALRVTKGMIKRSMNRYGDYRARIIREVEEAKARRDAAANELKTAEAKYAAVVGEQARTEQTEQASQITLDRIWLKVDQAKKVKTKREHQLMYAENELRAITRKHDFVFARIQSLYEMKERECQCKLKHTLEFLTIQMDTLVTGLRGSTLALHQAAASLEFKNDLKEFLANAVVVTSNSHKRINLESYNQTTDSKEPNMADSLGLKGFDRALKHANRNCGAIKSMELAIEAAIESSEVEIKLMRKWLLQYAKRSSTGVIFNVHDGYSLVPAFNYLAKVVEEMMRFWQLQIEQFQRFERGLHSLRNELKAHVKFVQKQHETELKAFDQAKSERDRAERELKKAKGEQDVAMEKHHEAQKAADRGEPVKKKHIFRWGKDDVHKLKAKMDQCIKKHNKCVDALQRKKEALKTANDLLEQRTRKNLDQMQATEQKRVDTIQQLATAFSEERAKRLHHILQLVHEAIQSAENCDLHANIQRFIKKNKTKEESPDYVKEDFQRSFGYYFHAEPRTPEDTRGVIWL